jgi:hypothetical protein
MNGCRGQRGDRQRSLGYQRKGGEEGIKSVVSISHRKSHGRGTNRLTSSPFNRPLLPIDPPPLPHDIGHHVPLQLLPAIPPPLPDARDVRLSYVLMLAFDFGETTGGNAELALTEGGEAGLEGDKNGVGAWVTNGRTQAREGEERSAMRDEGKRVMSGRRRRRRREKTNHSVKPPLPSDIPAYARYESGLEDERKRSRSWRGLPSRPSAVGSRTRPTSSL